MSKESQTKRSTAKKYIGYGFIPVFGIITFIYNKALEQALESNQLVQKLSQKLGVFMTSYYGLFFIALLFVMLGAFITLWIEDLLEKRQKTKSYASIEFTYDVEKETYFASETENIKYWRYEGDEDFPKVFVLFETALEKPIISVSAGVKNGNWSEQDSNESFAFVNIIRLKGSGWFHLHFAESRSSPHKRRQSRNVEMDVSYISPEARTRLKEIRVGLSKWDKMNKIQKFLHVRIKGLNIYDQP